MGSYYASCPRCGAEISGRYDHRDNFDDPMMLEPVQVTERRAEHEKECPGVAYEKKVRAEAQAEAIAAVVSYAEEHAEKDSVFLYPPNMCVWRVEIRGLLDHLHDVAGIPKPK